ncbi:MAG: DUF5671 domain-containing protein [Paracoccus sp. (in: a-proteobacteria)]|nr:DUF5671 domain-containing protein [Paracoccus sp. (in: a-proteobacteria)]
MTAQAELSDFVHRALLAGRDPTDIRAALAETGWTGAEIDSAMSAWQMRDGLPPIPVPRSYISAREAMLHVLQMIALLMVCLHTFLLGARVIDWLVPEIPGQGFWFGDVRFSIAALIAFLPLYVWLDLRMARTAADPEARRRSVARRGFASVTVLLAAVALLGDLVTTINALLAGDLTLRFVAKAGLVALIGLLVAARYREDLNG